MHLGLHIRLLLLQLLLRLVAAVCRGIVLLATRDCLLRCLLLDVPIVELGGVDVVVLLLLLLLLGVLGCL